MLVRLEAVEDGTPVYVRTDLVSVVKRIPEINMEHGWPAACCRVGLGGGNFEWVRGTVDEVARLLGYVGSVA